MKKSTKSAISIIDDNGVIFLHKTNINEYYKVTGLHAKWYEVIYNRSKDTYACNCKNVRLTPCKHIKAVILFKENITFI